jgi:hypothetical protein
MMHIIIDDSLQDVAVDEWQYMVVFIYDILMYSSSYMEHEQHLRNV